ncbi:hypothetical protein M3Y96_00233500 [Aphelenchoides besseyi]|nr:hypothetical protein M3Y96_00233500 [Aphelenchoides besseyi]
MSAVTATINSRGETSNKQTDDDEEYLVEPRFKYKRVVHDVAKRLEQDSASCVVVHDKFICIGFSSGRIAFFDHLGHVHFEKKVQSHRCSVSHLAVDGIGNYVISCANDKKVCIQGFGHSEFNQNIDVYPAAKCVALAEDFSKPGSSQSFIIAGQCLTFHERGFLGKRKTVLYQGLDRDGLIMMCTWKSSLIAFTNDSGTRIYDCNLKRIITLIQPVQQEKPIPISRFPPRHCWIDSLTLIVAWGTEEHRLFKLQDAAGIAHKKVEIINQWTLPDFFISGISFTLSDSASVCEQSWDEIVVFGFGLNENGESSQSDAETGGFDDTKAHPCLIDDRVSWFLENKLYKEALECALKDRSGLVETSISEIGRRLIHTLIEQNDFKSAAAYLTQICGRCKEEWEYYCELFEKHGEILKLVPYIPAGSPQLEPECYEWMLTAALYSRTRLFRKLIHEWNPDIYRAASIIDKILKRMADNHPTTKGANANNKDVNLLQSLAYLLAYVRNYERALDIYMLLKDKAIFGVIDRYHLFVLVKDRIVELMEISSDLAVRLLLDNEDSIPSTQVVKQLSKTPRLQMAYLNRLYSRGEANEHTDLMIRLYAEYDRPKLMPFLKKCEIYKLGQALEICKRKGYIQEVVYLLGRSGDRLKALDVIMTQLEDIDGAISFCMDHDYDVELWHRLVELSFRKPEHIQKLLAEVVSFVDALLVIEKIPDDVEIPGLKKALLKILRDYELQISLLKDSKKIGLEDCLSLMKSRVEIAANSNFVDVKRSCDACGNTIIFANDESNNFNDELLLLGCDHLFHSPCILSDGNQSIVCPICFSTAEMENEQKQKSDVELIFYERKTAIPNEAQRFWYFVYNISSLTLKREQTGFLPSSMIWELPFVTQNGLHFIHRKSNGGYLATHSADEEDQRVDWTVSDVLPDDSATVNLSRRAVWANCWKNEPFGIFVISKKDENTTKAEVCVTTAATIDGDASNFAVRLIGDDLLIHCDLPSQPTFYRVRGFLSASRVAFAETIEETGGIGLADVICSICLDTYNDPRTLSCGHSFCNQCLARLSAKVPVVCSAIRCPNCRNPSKIPTTGLPMNYGLKGQHGNVTRLPTEILILEAIEMLEKVRRSQTFDQRCSVCRLACVDEELWRCIDCDRGNSSICANCILHKHNNHAIKREVDFKNTKAIEEIRREFVNNTKAQFDRFSEELNEKFRLLVLESLEESLFNEHNCDLKAAVPTITGSSAI